MAQHNKILRMTTVNISELVKGNEELQSQLWNDYTGLQVASRDLTAAINELRLAAAKVSIAQGTRDIHMSQFMTTAAKVSDKVAMEPNWLPPFTNKEGDLVLESPFTQRDQRVAARVAHHNLNRAASQAAEDIGDDNEMFDGGEGDEDDNSPRDHFGF